MSNEWSTEKIKGIFNRQDMIMATNQQHWKDMTLKSLETKLRGLADVKVPETLEAKLLAAIPDRATEAAAGLEVRWYRWILDLGASTAAAVLILGLMLMLNYGFSVSSKMWLKDFDDALICGANWQQSRLLYDQNNAFVEKLLPSHLWQIKNQNEPGY